MRLFKVLVLVCCCTTLFACGRYQKRLEAYEQAHGVPPVTVPPGATAPVQEPYYSVPASGKIAPSTYSILPPGSNIAQYCKKHECK